VSPERFVEALLATSSEEQQGMLARRPAGVGEAQVDQLAEQARAQAPADPAASLRIAELAVRLAEALAMPRARALAQRAHAVALLGHARWVDALACFDEGARLATAAGDPLLAAQIPIAATDTLAQLGRYDEAFALARKLEAALRHHGAEADAAKVVANAGNIYFRREAYGEALRHWQQALAYFESRDAHTPVARLRMNVASALTHLHRLPEALGMYEAARVALERAGMEVLVGSTDLNVGYLNFLAGHYTEALQAYARARARFEALRLAKETAVCDRDNADLHRELNLLPEARDAYERGLLVFGKLQMAGEMARCEMGLAEVLAAQGQEPEALTALTRAEQIFRREGNEIGVARVQLLRAEQWLRARRCAPGAGVRGGGLSAAPPPWEELRAARRAFQRHGLKLGALQTRLRLSELQVETSGHPVRLLRQLRREADEARFISLGWQVEAALARTWSRAGSARGAAIHYRRAVDAVERLRFLLRGDQFRIAFLQDKTLLYEELLALLLERDTPAARREAFQLVERAKSRGLLELLARAVETDAGADPGRAALHCRLEGLRTRLNWDYQELHRAEAAAGRLSPPGAALPERVRQLEREYLRVQRELQLLEEPAARASRAAPGGLGAPPPLPRDLQLLLEDDEQIVEYATVRDDVIAFVLGRRGFQVVEGLAAPAEVAQEMRRFRFQLSRIGSGEAGARAAEALAPAARGILANLYELLLEPIAPLLSAPRLTVVPHGLLHGIPFHALSDGEEYALDRWEIAYAPSGAVWRAGRLRAEPAARESLVFGVSDPRLDHVHQEVAALAALLPEATVYRDDRATVAAVPADGAYRYLHFATHGVFRQDNPLFSGLRLADGWLIASDLYHRRLECRLATLSACRTGESQVVGGDETLGLARAFLHAGARAVLVSLWTVHDRATATMMERCYQGLAAGSGRAVALRAAQQAVRAQYPHPYHWAPFALIGAR
jgi:tetratricopeptide (TPR) repeat protein